MNLRYWTVCVVVVVLFSPSLVFSQSTTVPPRLARSSPWDPSKLGESLLPDPVWVYNDWSSYDELSDNIPLTEELAMRELREIVRLKKFGVHFDYYMMDAFWFAPDGGYRTWRKPNWPNGPDLWIQTCRENHILPGMWFGTNALVKINPVDAWKDSLTANHGALSLSAGGFLPDLMDVLQYWYDRGIRMFEFDFAYFDAATPEQEKSLTPAQIRQQNETAFRDALKKFRAKNPDVVLVAFNGFGGDLGSTSGPFPFHDPIDLRWLEAFSTLYAGDPRPSDVPEMNFWRSMDIYSDHMVRRYEQSFVPLERIDPTSFMLGDTGTIYYRKAHAWKGALLLVVSRGGWINTIHGNLEFLSDSDVRWFARLQRIFAPLKAEGRTKTFGGIPGDVEPYGFGSVDVTGAIYTVMNPGQAVRTLEMPLLSRVQPPFGTGRVLFRDAGFVPVLHGNEITLGPGQLAAVGFGRYSSPQDDLGVQQDVQIPRSIAPVEANFASAGQNAIEATVQPPSSGDLRIIFQQYGNDGSVLRSWMGGPPNGTSMGKVLKISAEQKGKPLSVEINYDKMIWSGLSWGVGEVKHAGFSPNMPILIRCSSAEKNPVQLKGRIYSVQY